MNLPPAKDSLLSSWKRIIEQADLFNVKRNEDRHFKENSVILYSADGTQYRLVVQNDGTLTTQQVS